MEAEKPLAVSEVTCSLLALPIAGVCEDLIKSGRGNKNWPHSRATCIDQPPPVNISACVCGAHHGLVVYLDTEQQSASRQCHALGDVVLGGLWVGRRRQPDWGQGGRGRK